MKTSKIEQEKMNAIEYLTKIGQAHAIPKQLEFIDKKYAKKERLKYRRNHVIFWLLVFGIVTAIMSKVKAQNIQKSDVRFAKTFMVEVSGKKYYTDTIDVFRDSVRFSEYNRNGSVRGYHCFSIREAVIHGSKNRNLSAAKGLRGSKKE